MLVFQCFYGPLLDEGTVDHGEPFVAYVESGVDCVVGDVAEAL